MGLLLAVAPVAAAQPISLSDLHRRALDADPRARQPALLGAQSALRERSIRTDQLPALTIEGTAQYQSDVPRLAIVLPGGATPPSPAHDSWDARFVAQQRIWDPSLTRRVDVERALRAESEARVATALHSLRQAVNDAYFTALLLQMQRGEVTLSVTDLEAQLRLARERVGAGTALPSESHALEAEVLRRRQTIAALDANRAAAIDVLIQLTGLRMGIGDSLAPVDLHAATRAARAVSDDSRVRPEYADFARTRDVLEAQERLAAVRDQPRVSAFGRFGYGRPGLNVLSDRFDSYWLAGVQLQWSPITWGMTRREREVLALQREIVDTEEAAFRESVRRAVTRDLASIDRLAAVLVDDERIITLRERILAEARVRYGEGVITAAEYVDRQTDLTNARLTRMLHDAELAQAQARLLTTLGLEVR